MLLYDVMSCDSSVLLLLCRILTISCALFVLQGRFSMSPASMSPATTRSDFLNDKEQEQELMRRADQSPSGTSQQVVAAPLSDVVCSS